MRAVVNPRTAALAAAMPPICSKDVSGRIVTTTRPLRSPNFSPSLVKTSSIRRWMAHCWPSGSGAGAPADGPA